MKVCIKCNIEKELDHFGKRVDSKDGHRNDCKECRKEFNDRYREDNKDTLKEYKKKYREENKEIIAQNGKIYREENKEIIAQNGKIYREENKEVLKEKSKKYREENKEILSERKKNYYEKNKEKENFRKNEWHKKRLKEDSLYKLKCSIRQLISQSIRNSGHRKHQLRLKKSEIILGCNSEFFKKYIEDKFLEGMNWDNHGEWHLDHIKPVSWANDEEELLSLNYYTNFQPKWSFDNLSKGNRYEG
jgi:hypothetical protein